MSKKSDAHSVVTNIEDYVRAKYPEFAALLDYCKLFNLTLPRPGREGITLLIPQDKKYIDEIRDLTFSTKAEDVGASCDMLLALMIRKAILKASDWTSDDIGDMRYPPQRVAAKVTASSVKIQAPKEVTVVQDPDFKVGFRSNCAIWLIKEGRMNPSKENPIPLRRRERRPASKEGKGVSGGYDLTKAHADAARFKIAIAAENEFVLQYMTREQGGSASTSSEAIQVCPFLAYVMSFARFMHDKHPREFYECVLPLIRYRVTDFYILFEPHRAVAPDQYLIPDVFINEWWDAYKYMRVVAQDIADFRAFVDRALFDAQVQCPAAVYNHTDDLIGEIDSVRLTITPSLQNPAQVANIIYAAYDNLANTNKLGDIDNVYPPMLAEYYRRHPRFKLAHDELSFVVEPIMIRIHKAFDIEQFRNVITMIGNVLHADSIQEIEAALPLVNRKKIELMSLSQNDALINEIRTFVNSTMFMWVPLTTARIEKYPIENVTTRPTDGNEALYNTDFALKLHHERLYSQMAGRVIDMNKELALAALSTIKPEQLSDELRAKMTVLLSK